MDVLQQTDPEVWQAIQDERRRQQQGLELIASENYTSPAVLAAQGSVLTNKYAEGYPGRRYYGGCEYVDVVERLAIDRALQLFRAERANVQPHSGAQANMAVYFACLEPGDTILAMDLAHGGHLTHGMRLNFSGKWYKVVAYGVRKDGERIDFDQVAEQALDSAGITVNKNMIPFDTRAPLDPSGIRVGTPALTTRGLREAEMRRIAAWMGEVLANPTDAGVQQRVRGAVREL